MEHWLYRTEMMFGKTAMERLASSRVAVFGIGGVGGYAAEALVRSGIGAIDIIDNDVVDITNINRQIYATMNTVGKYKVDAAEKRITDINPDIKICTHKVFFTPETSDLFDFHDYDYIVDAIDTVSGKLELAVKADLAGTPIISSMGAGNKLDPTAFEVADIYKTSVCPLAKVMRYELRRRGIKKLKTVYSKEPPFLSDDKEADCIDDDVHNNDIKEAPACKRIPGSNAFVPPAVGLIIAGEVIKDLINLN